MTLTVRVHDYVYLDANGVAWSVGGCRLDTILDSCGNPHSIIGLDPGTVRPCPKCERQVYVPDAARTEKELLHVMCPFADCVGLIPTTAEFGSRRVEDAPAGWTPCREHGDACQRPRETIA